MDRPSWADLTEEEFSETPFLFISFVDCKTIRSAIHRGFNTWSDNSARISLAQFQYP